MHQDSFGTNNTGEFPLLQLGYEAADLSDISPILNQA